MGGRDGGRVSLVLVDSAGGTAVVELWLVLRRISGDVSVADVSALRSVILCAIQTSTSTLRIVVAIEGSSLEGLTLVERALLEHTGVAETTRHVRTVLRVKYRGIFRA